jgi:aminopeptidase N
MKPLFLLFILGVLPLTAVAQPVNVYERPLQSEPSHDFDVLHYRIELDFEGENRAFQGETSIRLRALSDAFKSLVLHAETYEVKEVYNLEQGVLPFQHEDGVLQIQLADAIAYGDTISLTVKYGTERFEVNPEAYGMGANYPLGLGFFPANKDHPFLFNAYSFPNGARHWFPCYDHPNDRATHETIISTRGDHKVLANGILKSVRENNDGTVTYHWSQEQAHPTYLYNFVSGPYSIIEDEYEGMPVNYWVYPQDEDKALRSFHRTPEVLAFFEDYYGVKYPWDKYDQICVPGIGGGAEATTATLIGASTLHDEKAEKDFPSHWLVAHEAAHHWWGDFVSYRDWTQTWISESFATFSEYLYSAHLYGPEEGALNLLNKRMTYLNEAKNSYQRPIIFGHWEYPNQNFDRHTYQKGALVLHMLRDYLGEDQFRRVLQHFLTEHAYQPVDDHDFLKSTWEVTGQNVDWFFEQWFYQAGHPVLELDYTWENQEVVLNVRQVQDTSAGVPVFRMPVKIAITSAGETTVHTVWMEEARQVFRFPAKGKPQMLRFDPDHILLKEWTFDKSTEELLYQAKNDQILGRLWAVTELANRTQESKVLAFLRKCLTGDSNWAVRRAALESLATEAGQLPDQAKVALKDPHSQVRATAVQLLGDQQLAEWAQEFLRIYRSDDSYIVQAAALRALGKGKQPRYRSLYEEAMNTASPRDIIQRAATWALEQL